MNEKLVVKISYIVNTWLLFFVIGMMLLFKKYEADFLVMFSVPTILVYIINYALLYKRKLSIFVWVVYFWIALYMLVTTVCLGYSSGFQLYTMSLIPIAFYTEYMAYQIKNKSPNALWISIGLGFIYIICSAWSIIKGAVYQIDTMSQSVMMAANAAVVFALVIFYSLVLIKMIINSEEKLKRMALVDELTGLNNRHYMIEQLEKQIQSGESASWLAMIDIDNFKKINDKYGHNAGDYVLQHFSEIMKGICDKCEVSRWGGEEFLIMAENDDAGSNIMEELRQAVSDEVFIYNEQKMPVSITVGVAEFQSNMSIDSWVQAADARLYYGKNNGKNTVVWNIP